jgi:glycine/D-amino acid oxidase-like deaminating enzyme
MPVLADLSPEASFYAVPPAAGMRFKVAGHPFSLAGDPDRDRIATPEDTEAVLALVRNRIRDLDRFAVVETRTCFYDVTADERFVARTLGPAMMLSGFSGHGFKFGAVIGEKVAATLSGELSSEVLAAWIAGHEFKK